MVTDAQGRSFRKLRLSVTERCNLACQYCTPDRVPRSDRREGGLSARQFGDLVRAIHEVSPLTQVRLTGGEPLLYGELPRLIEILKELDIPRVSLTTNGELLKKRLPELMEAGLDSANLSLDSLDTETYAFLSRGGSLHRALDSLEDALSRGLEMKLNATILNGINGDDVLPLLEFAKERRIRLRYIELMAMGHMADHMDRYFFSQEEILRRITGRYTLVRTHGRSNRPARYWELEDGYRFGIIANTSDPFCSTCDRLRLSSDGKLYGCLSVDRGQSLLPLPEAASDRAESMESVLRKAMDQKQESRFAGSSLSMRSIGG